MIGKHWYLVCALLLSLLAGPGARAQAPAIPPDIQTIFDKAKSGKDLTEAEKARLQEFAKSFKAASGGAAAAGGASGNAAPSAAGQGSSTPCPPASASSVTAAAPTRAEYVVLVNPISLAETYGGKLGAHRAEFDRIFAKPGAGSSAAQAGPVLYIRAPPLPVHPPAPLWSPRSRPRVPNTWCWSSPSPRPTAAAWERTALNSIASFAKPGAGSSAAQAGPVLYISGAAGASVYASAVAEAK